MPCADQRAYTDRLNALLTPAGWTRKYMVHTSHRIFPNPILADNPAKENANDL